jgi:hypothetical protein
MSLLLAKRQKNNLPGIFVDGQMQLVMSIVPAKKALEAIFSLKGASLPHSASTLGTIRCKIASNAYLKTFSVNC